MDTAMELRVPCSGGGGGWIFIAGGLSRLGEDSSPWSYGVRILESLIR
jgi:hypothetical protein